LGKKSTVIGLWFWSVMVFITPLQFGCEEDTAAPAGGPPGETMREVWQGPYSSID
jgi:hypothetical protein